MVTSTPITGGRPNASSFTCWSQPNLAAQTQSLPRGRNSQVLGLLALFCFRETASPFNQAQGVGALACMNISCEENFVN